MRLVNDKGKLMLVIFVLAIFLIFIIVFYLRNSEDLGQRTPIVGDPVCGELEGEEARSKCCAFAHNREVVVDCLGEWKFNSENKICSFVCSNGESVVCTQEAKLCDDNVTYVSRNSSNNCAFDECP